MAKKDKGLLTGNPRSGTKLPARQAACRWEPSSLERWSIEG